VALFPALPRFVFLKSETISLSFTFAYNKRHHFSPSFTFFVLDAAPPEVPIHSPAYTRRVIQLSAG
jgi:hypothetical protein